MFSRPWVQKDLHKEKWKSTAEIRDVKMLKPFHYN